MVFRLLYYRGRENQWICTKKIMPMTGDNGFWKFGFIGFGTIAVLGTGLIIFDKKGKKQKHRRRVTKK